MSKTAELLIQSLIYQSLIDNGLRLSMAEQCGKEVK